MGDKKTVPKERPAQLIPPQQKPKTTPAISIELPLPPLLHQLQPQKCLQGHILRPETPSTSTAAISSTVQKPRARSASTEARRTINAFYFCEETLDNPHLDHTLKQSLKPLRALKKIDEKDITNPYLFKDAPKLNTFVRSAGNRTKELWHFIDEASRADVMLVDTKNVMLKKMLPFCVGRVPILVYPSSIGPWSCGALWMSVELPGTTESELGTGFLRQAVGILTPKHSRPIVTSE